jgi:hypothetical protein
MKTPREILLAQHRAATPRLDALRHSVLAGLNNQGTKVQSFPSALVTWLLGCSNKLWLELVWPSRRIWAGFATVWALIFIANFAQRDNVSSVTGQPVHSSGPVMSLQAQQRWMNELFADRVQPPDADRPRNFTPKPRTQAAVTATV